MTKAIRTEKCFGEWVAYCGEISGRGKTRRGALLNLSLNLRALAGDALDMSKMARS